eukprot:2511553-Amphidinium_carterae.1
MNSNPFGNECKLVLCTIDLWQDNGRATPHVTFSSLIALGCIRAKEDSRNESCKSDFVPHTMQRNNPQCQLHIGVSCAYAVSAKAASAAKARSTSALTLPEQHYSDNG